MDFLQHSHEEWPITALLNKLFSFACESSNEKGGIFQSVYIACKSGWETRSKSSRKEEFNLIGRNLLK